MRNNKIIPKFKNLAEEAEFWDKNDVTDFLPEMKVIKVKSNLKIIKEDSVVIRIQPKMKKRLEMIAEDEGLPLSTMLRIWFTERLGQYKSF